MELTQLYQFREIALHENMTKAAENLHMSQPALSRAVNNLESELDVKLFTRNNNKLTLTKAGAVVLKYTEFLFDNIDFMKNELTDLELNPTVDRTSIRIASFSSGLLREIAPPFLIKYQNINLCTTVITESDCLESILSNSFDVAFSTKPLSHPTVHSFVFAEARQCISVPITHPLANKNIITTNDLEGTVFARMSKIKESVLHTSFDESIKESGVNAEMVFYDDYGVYERVLETSDCLAIANTFSSKPNIYHGRKLILYKNISGAYQKCKLYISYIKNNESKLLPFLDYIRNNQSAYMSFRHPF